MSSAQAGSTPVSKAEVPAWAQELIDLYESNAASQFIIYGNVNDRMLVPSANRKLGFLSDFLLEVLLCRFDVVLSYDVGNGLRVEKGGETFCKWPQLKDNPALPKAPRQAVEFLTHYFRYCANLSRLNQPAAHVACYIRGAELLAPVLQGGLDYDLSALATLIRDWSSDGLLGNYPLATFLITENLNDLHPLIANNPRTARIKLPLPAPGELRDAFETLEPSYAAALADYKGSLDKLGNQLAGATLSAVEGLLKSCEHKRQPIAADQVLKIKKEIVEKDCSGLIEFVESRHTLDDLYGLEKVKAWLRQDIALWKQDDLAAIPKGYLLCGPVGTGKTFLMECLAGEAGAPVVKLRNFRDKWVGSTEGNLEKIFRLLQALGRCYVFIDEADQTLGKRDSSGGDSGISGRVYSMMAEEMGSSTSRGRIIWVLASSRPDLIEVDLKRPGRVDVKIPLFPTTTPEESFSLIRMLCGKRNMEIPESAGKDLQSQTPTLLTPGAADTLAMKIYRLVQTTKRQPLEVLRDCLTEYQNPVPLETLESQIRLAVKEATDLEFVPTIFRIPVPLTDVRR